MSARGFVHLHTHSHYSLLEALPRIPELVAAAKKDGQKALALTDNGNLYGAIEFYKECKTQGHEADTRRGLFRRSANASRQGAPHR